MKSVMVYGTGYICSVALVNLAFAWLPLLALPGGEFWSPAGLLVGFTFVIRDYAQREIGQKVVPAMLVGGAISGFMAGPGVAAASVCAFLVSDFLDWAVYTFTGRPFAQRVLFSSALSTPVDSSVFLFMVGIFSIPGALMMTASKMAGAVVVYMLIRRRESLPA